ncbi:DUF6376 family protein [Aneurinibacillus tyrosinisolvens]|uniref:DUF6376 family protein n=1 Tax=Aneurinibacillus tyrosinisolvens TaxID=1443435 RepID=UPI00069AB348|nr:DUF6376 family protein [Aneurinibacillus tyrosinisolvens]
MRKLMLLFLILSSMMLSACSLIEGANNSLEYVNQATEHINKLSNFAEQAPQMMKDAALNPEAKQELENQLNGLKKEIEQFNLISPPSIAKDIHQQLVDKNEVLLQEINKVVENGHLALDKLENSQLVNTINDITGLIDRIKNLGL